MIKHIIGIVLVLFIFPILIGFLALLLGDEDTYWKGFKGGLLFQWVIIGFLVLVFGLISLFTWLFN